MIKNALHLRLLMILPLFVAVSATESVLAQAVSDEGGFLIGGKVNVSPFIDINWLHDTNPNNSRDGKINNYRKMLEAGAYDSVKDSDDFRDPFKSTDGYTVRPGVNFSVPGNCWNLYGRALYMMERYDRGSADDRDDWEETMTIYGETDSGLAWRLDEYMRHSQYETDYEFSQDDRLVRNVAGSLVKKLSAKTSLEVRGSYYDIDYDDETLYDSRTLGVTLGLARGITEKTALTLRASYSRNEEDSFKVIRTGTELNDYYKKDFGTDTSTSVRVLLGLSTKTTEKLSFDGGIGFVTLKNFEGFKDERSQDLYDNDRETGFSYDLNAIWTPYERLSFSLSGVGDYQPAEDVDSNSILSHSLSLSASYRIAQRVKLRAKVSYIVEDYTRKVAEDSPDKFSNPYRADDKNGDNRTDDKLSMSGGVVFSLSSYSSIFADVSKTDVSSSIDDFDYDRTRISLGMALRY